MRDPILVADLFCGAGGFSTGAVKAMRDSGVDLVLTCVNHWPVAIETHSRNHPEARHYIEDLTVADPNKLVPEGRLDLLMASPECTYHSNARGGKPIHDQKRMDPWAVIRWLTHLDVRCVLIENVPEFVNWGPLNGAGRPDKAKRGLYFEAWRNAIGELGYDVQHRVLNAADFGDATTRTRFFMQARKDGLPIRWPEPSHAKAGPDAMFQNRRRWRSAREIIDWSNPGRSLFDHPKYKRQPLSEKTRLRIARGLKKFGGPLAPLYIALLGVDGSASRAAAAADFIVGKQARPSIRDVGQPLMTVTTMSAPHLVQPVAELVGANRNNNVPHGVDEPIPGLTTAPGGGVYLLEVDAEPFTLSQQSGGAPRSAGDPLATIATDGAISLVQPFLVPYYRTGVAHDCGEPLATITTQDRHALTWALVVPYGPRAEVRSVEEPLPTVLTKDRLAVAEAFIVPKFGEREGQEARVHSLDTPVPTVTGDGAGRLVNPMVIQMAPRHAEVAGVRPIDEPIYTVVTNARQSVVNPCLVAVNHGDDGRTGDRSRSVDEPLGTVTTHRSVALAEPVLEAIRAGELDPRRLVVIDDQLYQLDIRFRMLVNRELARAMSFDDEETVYEFVGNSSEVTKQIGNAVPVQTAMALVKAVLL